MFDVDFEKESPQVICHKDYQNLIPKIMDGLKSFELNHHFILFSSGTSGTLKGYAISREALFTNASAVNKHFALTKSDVWGLSLPIYHIGGLSVLARAHLLNNKVIDLRKWDVNSWMEKIQEVTITTIVPTQLYDLVKFGLRSPANLRYLVVGGDFLSSTLKEEALKLGWPVIRTFGMSEVSSQLASSKSPASDDLEILSIHEVKTNDEDRLLIKSPSLFTLQFSYENSLKVKTLRELCDKEGFYKTFDQASILGNTISHLGRLSDDFKISGHLVNLNQIKDTLGQYLIEHDLFGQIEIVLESDERKGKKLVLLTLPELDKAHTEIASLLYPVKIDEVRVIESFARTALGKLKRN
jgi:o-succinylbenzoate---CoA ligase